MKSNIKKKLIAYSIVSPLQLVNFLSYWHSHKEIYNKVIVFVDFYWGYNIICQRYLDFCEKKSIEIYYNSDNKDIFLNTPEKKDIVFVGAPSVRILLKNNRIDQVVVVDEGLSTYAGFKNLKKANKREKNVELSLFKYNIKKIFFLIYSIFFKEIKYFFAFNKKTGYVNVDYKNAILDFLPVLGEDIPVENRQKTIVFCSQPYVELGLMSESEYISYLHAIKLKIEDRGGVFVLKKHPVEKIVDYESYGIDVLSFDGIIEEYVCINRISAVISKVSTSSMLIPALFDDVNCYLVDFAELKDFSSLAHKIFDNYCFNLREIEAWGFE